MAVSGASPPPIKEKTEKKKEEKERRGGDRHQACSCRCVHEGASLNTQLSVTFQADMDWMKLEFIHT